MTNLLNERKWDAVRRELSVTILNGILSKHGLGEDVEETVNTAVRYADALMRRISPESMPR